MVLAAIDDLFFLVKVKDAAERAGMGIAFAKSPADLLERARASKPRLVVIDLNATALSPLEMIRTLKAEGEFQIVAFVSHVQVDLKKAAQEAGADRVIARSAFSQNLNAIMLEASAVAR